MSRSRIGALLRRGSRPRGAVKAAPRGVAEGSLRRLTAWLGTFALLVQLVIPDLAMAALNRVPMELDFGSIAGHDHLNHEGGLSSAHHAGHQSQPQQTQPRSRPKPTQHAHGAFCPFCVVQAAHALPPADTSARIPSAATASAKPSADTGVVPERHFLSCLRCRAPPHALRV